MKSIICSVLIGLSFAAVFILSRADALFDELQIEINKRVLVLGAMGGNITLRSNDSIGSGAFSVVLSGEANDGTPTAIKVTSIHDIDQHKREYECYRQLHAMTNKTCEKYGIPFVYHSGDFLGYKTITMTMLDYDLLSLRRRYGAFSRNSILIILRDMIRTLKFMHSKGIHHQDIHLGNIMTKGANIFLFDFNLSADKKSINNTMEECLDQGPTDMERVLHTMTVLASIKVFGNPEKIINSNVGIREQKRQMKEELLLGKMKFTEFAEPYVELWFEVFEAKLKKRTPKYDYLHNMFNDLLYAGQNRSERIVFEWLTPEERVFAMTESIPSIESIVFPEEKDYQTDHILERF